MLQVLRYINAVCSPDNGLTPSERLVLICHATHVNNATGETFVSSETVAAETGVTDRTVRKARRMARESGWLTERRPAKRRSGHATVWALPPLDRGQTPDGWGRDTPSLRELSSPTGGSLRELSSPTGGSLRELSSPTGGSLRELSSPN
ncbi:helix-turn-helix domain-containing protein [Arsenicicoccus dermatophilus]|uniref:helix-turn-helix domain-containing protein n=1 Tax=Arsenicicoccus dermatophilus TaxID=1076331 RepID=UPI003B980DE9